MSNTLSKIYDTHHTSKKRAGFSVLEEVRGKLLSSLVGTGKRVLDLGCRDGTLTKHFVKGNTVMGVDVDQNSLIVAREQLGIETLWMDLNGNWSELNGISFDVVVAGEVLEHLYFPETVIQKVVEKLHRPGVFIGSVPNAFSLKNRLRYMAGRKRHTPLADPTHINHFSVRELTVFLEKHFDTVEIMGLGRYVWLARHAPSLFAFDLFFVARLSDSE
jgi:2-polyprenyl-3-methyl-5-hydroxy-6-metoxy-1,4-benzoquinol methylase